MPRKRVTVVRPTRTIRVEDVPIAIHGAFKGYCARRGYNMRAALIALMVDAAKENRPLRSAQRSRNEGSRCGRPPR